MKKIETRPNGSKKVSTENKKPSMTDQSYKDQVDAKNVIKSFVKTGLITHLNQVAGQYADVSEIESLYESMTKVKQAENFFYQLPAEIRKQLKNDPQEMLKVLKDPSKEEIKKDLFPEEKVLTDDQLAPDHPDKKDKGDKDVKNT
jgi:hypothetical protein